MVLKPLQTDGELRCAHGRLPDVCRRANKLWPEQIAQQQDSGQSNGHFDLFPG